MGLFQTNSSKIILGPILLLLLSGCDVVFLKPLSGPAGFRQDTRLLGRWISEDKDDKGSSFQFDRGTGLEINVSAFPGDPNDKNPVFTIVSTRIGKHDYMNLNPTDKDRNKGYLVTRYLIENDELTVWMLDSDKVKAAISQGKIKGEAGAGSGPSVTVTDTTENALKFLELPENAAVFKLFGKFKKAKSP